MGGGGWAVLSRVRGKRFPVETPPPLMHPEISFSQGADAFGSQGHCGRHGREAGSPSPRKIPSGYEIVIHGRAHGHGNSTPSSGRSAARRLGAAGELCVKLHRTPTDPRTAMKLDAHPFDLATPCVNPRHRFRRRGGARSIHGGRRDGRPRFGGDSSPRAVHYGEYTIGHASSKYMAEVAACPFRLTW